MEPEVVFAGHAEGELVVLPVVAADEEVEAAGGLEVVEGVGIVAALEDDSGVRLDTLVRPVRLGYLLGR